MLLQSLLLIPTISLLLRTLGFQRSLSLVDRLSRRRSQAVPSRTEQADAAAICRLVGMASRHGLCAATCLRQALVLWFLLRRRGMPAELRIGVRKTAEGLEAHAWVESDGRVLDGTDSMSRVGATANPFTKFDSLIECTG